MSFIDKIAMGFFRAFLAQAIQRRRMYHWTMYSTIAFLLLWPTLAQRLHDRPLGLAAGLVLAVIIGSGIGLSAVGEIGFLRAIPKEKRWLVRIRQPIYLAVIWIYAGSFQASSPSLVNAPRWMFRAAIVALLVSTLVLGRVTARRNSALP